VIEVRFQVGYVDSDGIVFALLAEVRDAICSGTDWVVFV
jgi:hypothetical protein